MATLRPGALQQDVWDAALQKHLAAAPAAPDAEAATTWVALWHAVHAAMLEPQHGTPSLEVFVTRHVPFSAGSRPCVRSTSKCLPRLHHCCLMSVAAKSKWLD